MSNAEIYRFTDFTLQNYRKLLELGCLNYDFILFSDILNENKRQILLRHDVEFSVFIAMKMAEIEANLGIRATYFVQVHSDFYNILEKNNFLTIKKIQSLGHEIGLHFDIHFWEIESKSELERYMEIDKQVIKFYFNFDPKAFSFHNTNSFILSCDADCYAGMINVYSKKLKTNIGYCSDSTGYWRFEVLENRLKDALDNKLQILIHDGMWQDEVLPPRRRIYKVIDDHACFMKKSYDETLKKFGAKNIDWNDTI